MQKPYILLTQLHFGRNLWCPFSGIAGNVSVCFVSNSKMSLCPFTLAWPLEIGYCVAMKS